MERPPLNPEKINPTVQEIKAIFNQPKKEGVTIADKFVEVEKKLIQTNSPKFKTLLEITDWAEESKPRNRLYEDNLNNLEGTAVKKILELINTAPNSAKKSSSDVIEDITASLKEANAICKKRISDLLEKFESGKPLSNYEKDNLSLYNNLQTEIRHRMSAQRISPSEKYKKAA